jgi:hypothetical protein
MLWAWLILKPTFSSIIFTILVQWLQCLLSNVNFLSSHPSTEAQKQKQLS